MKKKKALCIQHLRTYIQIDIIVHSTTLHKGIYEEKRNDPEFDELYMNIFLLNLERTS